MALKLITKTTKIMYSLHYLLLFFTILSNTPHTLSVKFTKSSLNSPLPFPTTTNTSVEVLYNDMTVDQLMCGSRCKRNSLCMYFTYLTQSNVCYTCVRQPPPITCDATYNTLEVVSDSCKDSLQLLGVREIYYKEMESQGHIKESKFNNSN